MLLSIGIALACLYAVLKPFGDGLYDTSMLVAKMMAPADSEDNETTQQCVRIGQAALMEGWLSNVPFITSILFVSSIIAGFLYHWWGGIIMFFLAAILGGLASVLWRRPVAYYLPFLYHKMVNRAADYKKRNDTERLEASESYCEDLQRIILLYRASRLKPPNQKQLKGIPCGNVSYWLESQSENV